MKTNTIDKLIRTNKWDIRSVVGIIKFVKEYEKHMEELKEYILQLKKEIKRIADIEI